MSKKSASIDTPDVIREFRKHFIAFDGQCRRALSGVGSDVQRTLNWLRHDQASHWKRELRKREEAAAQAKQAYNRARNAPSKLKRPSYMDEQKALEKAERHKDDARRKTEATRRWAGALEEKVEKMRAPLVTLSSMLEDLSPKAINRLDRMIDSLDEYFRESPVDTTPPSAYDHGNAE